MERRDFLVALVALSVGAKSAAATETSSKLISVKVTSPPTWITTTTPQGRVQIELMRQVKVITDNGFTQAVQKQLAAMDLVPIPSGYRRTKVDYRIRKDGKSFVAVFLDVQIREG